jgi:hypothetical protein
MFIFLILVMLAAAAEVTPKRVNVKIYFESDCPNCQDFWKRKLGPLWKKDKEGKKSHDKKNSVKIETQLIHGAFNRAIRSHPFYCVLQEGQLE